jgi:hypothetical protein
LLSRKYQNTNTKNAFKPNPKNQTKTKRKKKKNPALSSFLKENNMKKGNKNNNNK